MQNQNTYPTFLDVLTTSLLTIVAASIMNPGIAKAGGGDFEKTSVQQEATSQQLVIQQPVIPPVQQPVTQVRVRKYSVPPKYRIVTDPREAGNLLCYMKTSDGKTLDLKEFCAMTENTVKK